MNQEERTTTTPKESPYDVFLNRSCQLITVMLFGSSSMIIWMVSNHMLEDPATTNTLAIKALWITGILGFVFALAVILAPISQLIHGKNAKHDFWDSAAYNIGFIVLYFLTAWVMASFSVFTGAGIIRAFYG